MSRSGVVRTRVVLGAAAILVSACALAAPTVAAFLRQQQVFTATLSWALNGALLLALLGGGLALRAAAMKARDPSRRLRQAASLIAAAPVDMIVRDKSLRLVGLSAGMQRFVDIAMRNGWAKPEYIDLGFLSGDERDRISPPASVAALAREFQAVVATGEPREYDLHLEVELVGVKAAFQGRVAPLRGADAAVIGMMSAGRYFQGHGPALDQSAIAHRRAERINDTKTRFLATVSRKVRNPLNVLTGLLEMASLDASVPGQSKEMLATVRSSARSLLQLVPSLIDTRGMEAGGPVCAATPVALRTVAADVVALFAPSAYQKGISLTLEVAQDVAACHLTSALGLSQLLNNFLSNAIRFTQQGGVRIRLDGAAAEDGRQWITLSVIDTGSGIAPHIQQQLSESRYEAGLSESPDGAGLGLHYCQQMVLRSGGTIDISSVVGAGTQVQVRLPLPLGQDQPPGVPQETAPGLAQRPAAGLRTLVIESEAGNRLLLKSQLEFLGHEVRTAGGGAQALALAGEGRFDLVVCDCAMPDRDAAALIRALRAQGRGSAPVPVLGYTADTCAADRAEGMDEVLVKPAGLQALEAAVTACLQARAANGPLPGGAA